MSSGEKSFNHWFLWTFPFFTYYFVFKNELFHLFTLSEIKDKIFKCITFVTLFACSFSVLEFYCKNFLGIELDFIPRGVVEDYNPFDGAFRARSFVEESGQFSFFIEIFGPISVFWITKNLNFPLKFFALTIIILGLLSTMSGVGILLLAIYLFLTFEYYIFKKKTTFLFRMKVIFVLAGFFVIFLEFQDFFLNLQGLVAAKIDGDNASHSDRVSRFDALSKLSGLAYIIGYGPAAFSTLQVDSFISLYLGILMNTGVIGLVLFFLFCLQKFKTILRIEDLDIRFALKCSFLFACIHLVFIDTIYVPWFWVMLVFIDVINKKEKLNLV